jgi:hypothetical protein
MYVYVIFTFFFIFISLVLNELNYYKTTNHYTQNKLQQFIKQFTSIIKSKYYIISRNEIELYIKLLPVICYIYTFSKSGNMDNIIKYLLNIKNKKYKSTNLSINVSDINIQLIYKSFLTSNIYNTIDTLYTRNEIETFKNNDLLILYHFTYSSQFCTFNIALTSSISYNNLNKLLLDYKWYEVLDEYLNTLMYGSSYINNIHDQPFKKHINSVLTVKESS